MHPAASTLPRLSVATPEILNVCFATNRVFDGIGVGLSQEIIGDMEVRSYENDEIIFQEGDRGDVLYLVGEGSVRISKIGRGGDQETLGFIERGNFFGEMALLDGEPRSAMAAAAAPTVLGVVNEKTFQRILEIAPSRLHLNFLRSVTQRLRQINSHFITEVMRTERLSLLGTMASMIIHDLNNPICTMRCCCDVIQRDSTDPNLVEAAELLNSAANGMLAMTQELLDFAHGSISLNRQSILTKSLFDKLFQQVLPLLSQNKVQVVTHLNYTGNIEVDVARMNRVLGNLVKNAREAMPDGGTLTFTTDLVGEEIVIGISDTGVGIPPEILPQLFEAFVTYGKADGTGLGMAIAKSVIDAHQGKISVSSIVGSGTTAEIRIPTLRAGN